MSDKFPNRAEAYPFSHEVDHDVNPTAIHAIKDRQEGRTNNLDVENTAEEVEDQTHEDKG